MISAALASLLTLAIGPGMFFLIDKLLYSGRNLKRYPVGLADSLGDAVFLPLFNAIAVHYGIIGIMGESPTKITIALFITLVISAAFYHEEKYVSRHNDWSRPRRGKFNIGGWYHLIFLIFQTFFVLITMLYLYDVAWLYLSLTGYLITFLYYVFVQLPQRDR